MLNKVSHIEAASSNEGTAYNPKADDVRRRNARYVAGATPVMSPLC